MMRADSRRGRGARRAAPSSDPVANASMTSHLTLIASRSPPPRSRVAARVHAASAAHAPSSPPVSSRNRRPRRLGRRRGHVLSISAAGNVIRPPPSPPGPPPRSPPPPPMHSAPPSPPRSPPCMSMLMLIHTHTHTRTITHAITYACTRHVDRCCLKKGGGGWRRGSARTYPAAPARDAIAEAVPSCTPVHPSHCEPPAVD
jgi:hypothetical protein